MFTHFVILHSVVGGHLQGAVVPRATFGEENIPRLFALNAIRNATAAECGLEKVSVGPILRKSQEDDLAIKSNRIAELEKMVFDLTAQVGSLQPKTIVIEKELPPLIKEKDAVIVTLRQQNIDLLARVRELEAAIQPEASQVQDLEKQPAKSRNAARLPLQFNQSRPAWC